MKFGVALADDYLRQMRKRREVAGSADGTLRGNYRMDFCVEHRAKSFYRRRLDAAEAFRQSVGPEKHHRARFGFTERFADAATVRADQIHL